MKRRSPFAAHVTSARARLWNLWTCAAVLIFVAAAVAALLLATSCLVPSAVCGPAATCRLIAARTLSASHGPASSAWLDDSSAQRCSPPQRACSSFAASFEFYGSARIVGVRSIWGPGGGYRASNPPPLPHGGCMKQLKEEPRGSVESVGEGQSSCKKKKQFRQVWSAQHAARPCSTGAARPQAAGPPAAAGGP